MEKSSKIYVAGHTGLIGGSILRALEERGYTKVITRTHAELELTNGDAVKKFFETERPEYVFLAAAKVGGILANRTYSADFIYENIAIQNNVIHNAYKFGAQKLLFFGSTNVYPRLSPQPMKEEYLLRGEVEETSKPYAIAKIAGITLCQAYNAQYGTKFVSMIPNTVYGPNDKFSEEYGHVIPALIDRFHKAKQSGTASVSLWGTGTPEREFMYVDDIADACLFIMNTETPYDILNAGGGQKVTVKELAEEIKKLTGFTGTIVWDQTKPDGAPRKLLDITRMNKLGWKAQVSLAEGLARTYAWYKENYGNR